MSNDWYPVEGHMPGSAERRCPWRARQTSALPRTVDLAVPEFCNSAAAWRRLITLLTRWLFHVSVEELVGRRLLRRSQFSNSATSSETRLSRSSHGKFSLTEADMAYPNIGENSADERKSR
jgi:hypothetical protein